jgi:CBS domain-containing protein
MAVPKRARLLSRLLADRQTSDGLVSVAGLIGAQVTNQAGGEIGRVDDAVVRWQGEPYPPLTGLIVKIGRRKAWVHAEQIETLAARTVRLGSARFDLRDAKRRSGEVALNQDVVDHQMVDVDGVRVFRATDLYLADVDGHFRLVGADIGFGTLLRRLGPSRWRGIPTPERVIDWAAIQPFVAGGEAGEPVRLSRPNEELHRLRPGELADLLEDLGRPQRQELLAALDTDEAADALEEMEAGELASLLRELPTEQTAAVVAEMEPDEATEALRELDEASRDGLLAAMPAEVAAELRGLLEYPEATAGGVMTSDIVAARLEATVAETRELLGILDEEDRRWLPAVVVVDDAGAAVGDVSAMVLFLADPQCRLGDLIGDHPVVLVEPDEPLEMVIEALVEARASSLIVADELGRPVGRILADDVVDALLPTRGRLRFPRLLS